MAASGEGYMPNELLCFVTHKLDVMPPDSIILLCVNFYGDDDIETASKTLFELCANPENRGDRYKR